MHTLMHTMMRLCLLLLSFVAAVAAEAKEESGRFFIHADILTRDEEAGITRGIGNVEVAYGTDVITADEITLFEEENRIVARGLVRLLDKSGTVTHGRQAIIYDGGERIEMESPRVTLPEGSRVVARVLEKRSDDQYVLHHGVFTPCAPCADKKKKPLWQIRATRAVNDRKGQNMHYYNAVFEVMGTPVFYLPYHSHPDPTVKRRSGWLRTRFGHSKDLGDMYFLHYFGVISPHFVFDFKPFHTNHDGWVLRADSTIRTKRGKVSLEAAGAKSPVKRSGQTKAREQRRTFGRIKAEFDANKNWRWGGQYSRATDPTFLRRYAISGERTTKSNLYLEGFTPRNYARAEVLSYQDFREGALKSPHLYPSLQYNLVTKPEYRMGSWDVKLDFTNYRLDPDVKPSTARFVTEVVKKYLSTSKGGLVFEFTQNLRANFYRVSERTKSKNNNGKGDVDEHRFTSRITPRFLTTIGYPLASVRDWGYFSLTPKIGAALGANRKHKKSIPNIDTNEVEFDESDLFIANRATGYDRSESGKRLDYGLGFGAFLKDGKGVEGFLGQSYRIDKDPLFSDLGGAGQGYSDYVGNFKILPGGDFAFNYRFRLDKKDLDLRISEASTDIGGDTLGISVSYLKVKLPYKFNKDDNKVKRREDLNYSVRFKLNDYWGGSLGSGYNIETNQSVRYNLRFGYSDECFAAEFLMNRRYVHDRDYSADDTIIFQFTFKYIGPLQVK